MIDPLYVASGFAVGLLVGMTGVGGGSLMTPLLILLFGIHPATAVGTDLLYAAATKTGGGLIYGLGRSIHWPAVIRLASGSIPASIATMLVMWKLDLDASAQGRLVNTVLCFALVLTATALIFRKAVMERYRLRLQRISEQTTAVATVLTGAVLGVLVSISSVGAGAVGVTALLLLYPRLPMVQIVGSDIVHAVPLTLVAGTGHWGARLGRLAVDGRAADGLASGHRDRQLQRATRARDGAAGDARDRPDIGGGQDRLPGTASAVAGRHRASKQAINVARACYRDPCVRRHSRSRAANRDGAALRALRTPCWRAPVCQTGHS